MGTDAMEGYILSEDAPTPLYYQLKTIIVDCINRGIYVAGNKLPSERELAEKFSINRLTVRQSMNALVSEGILVRRRGMGTFVNQPKLEQGLLQLTSFTEDMVRQGFHPQTRLISFRTTRLPKQVAQKINHFGAEDVFRIERLRLADGEPMALEIAYLPSSKFPHINLRKNELDSLYMLMENKYGIRIKKAHEYLEAGLAGPRDAKLLQIKQGDPVLLRERLTFAENEEPVEFVKSVYRADKYRFQLKLMRNPGAQNL